MCATRLSCRVVVLGLLTCVGFTQNVLAGHLPPVDPAPLHGNDSHDEIRGLVDEFSLAGQWWGIAYEASSQTLLLSDYTNSVSHFSTLGSFIESTQTPLGVAGIDVLPNGDWLLVSDVSLAALRVLRWLK